MNALAKGVPVTAQERLPFLRRHAFELLIVAIIAAGLLTGLLVAAWPEPAAPAAASAPPPPAQMAASAPATGTVAAASAPQAAAQAKLPPPASLADAAAQLDAPNSSSAELSTAPDADVRAAALRTLDVNSAGSLPLLEDALRTDTAARNRLLAINALRLSGRTPAHTQRVRAALHSALADPDQNVATSARDALAEISR